MASTIPADITDGPDDPSIEVSIRREQAKANAKTARVTLRGSIVTTIAAAVIVWTATGSLAIVAWAGGLVAATLMRLTLIERYDRHGLLDTDPEFALRRSWQNSVLHGLFWGALPFIAFDGLPAGELAFVAFLIAGASAGSTIQSRAFAPAGIAFIAPTLLGLVAYCLWIGSPSALILGALTLLNLAISVQNVRDAERSFRAMHRARIEATRLAASLDRAHAKAVAAKRQLAITAETDALTGLANRGAFNAALDEACARAASSGGRFALLVIDLDRFKLVNDTYGHAAGDRLLVEVGRRLTACVRPTDRVARLGGDEFAIILGETAAVDDIAERILAALARPTMLGDRPTVVGGSIGGAVFPTDARTGEELFANADAALYAAKDAGRRRWRPFDAALGAAIENRRRIELDLPDALASGALEVHFQPQLRLPDAAVVGFEALIRWRHPARGWIEPPILLEAAAGAMLAERLADFVLDRACRLSADLDRLGLAEATVSVNVSPRDFGAFCPATLARSVLARHGIDTRSLEIEITEDALLDPAGRHVELERLATSGLRLAVDDFGAGHASLAYLAVLQVDRIKIDRSFIAPICSEARDRSVVEAILGIGRVLDVAVMAEGVETLDQVKALVEIGCLEAQGFLFGHPMPADALTRWIAAWPQSETAAAVRAAARRPLRLAGE